MRDGISWAEMILLCETAWRPVHGWELGAGRAVVHRVHAARAGLSSPGLLPDSGGACVVVWRGEQGRRYRRRLRRGAQRDEGCSRRSSRGPLGFLVRAPERDGEGGWAGTLRRGQRGLVRRG